MHPTLVIFPKVTFEQICRALNALGWNRQPDTMVTPPILPGEPEFAAWTHRSSASRIVYTFNPVVYLRVLAFYGEEAARLNAQVAQALPTLDVPQARDLLRSADVRQLLLGIFAAGELRALPVLNELNALRAHPERMVAQAATKAYEQLSQFAVQQGMAHLAAEKARRPDRSVLFPRLGDVHARRQIVRWLIHDYATANDDILAVLRTALEDEDWEVRATAMLAAARLRATPLGKSVRQVELPRTSREGLDATDRRVLVAMRKATLALLSGQPVAEEPEGPPTTRATMQAHLMRCVAGLPVKWHDRAFLLAYALTQPLLETESLQPIELPQGIIAARGAYRLAKTGVELVWVPPVPHWLGEESEHPIIPNPIRMVTPKAGFLVTRRPITRMLVRRIAPDLFTDQEASNNADYYTCSWLEAQRLCDALSQTEGLLITLPTADEWEMTARGPDGRRFPWGNGFERDMLRFASPWGGQDIVGIIGQWTSTSVESRKPIVCGGTDQLRCAIRTTASPNSSHMGLRPAVKL